VIPDVPHWQWSCVAGEITLLPPEGPRAGIIRYRERLRPLDRVRRLVDAIVDPALVITATRAPEHRATAEGEDAAWVVQEARRGDAPARRFVGFVLGDDCYARLVAVVHDLAQAARFETVAGALLAADTHARGVRRRRYRYAAPAGWLGRRLDDFHEEWTPHEHPRDPTRILVCPAAPATGGDPLAVGLAALAREPRRDFTAEQQHGPVAVEVSPLAAAHVQLVGRRDDRPAVRDVLLLRDERYVYPLAADSTAPLAARNRALLEALAATVVPVPRGEVAAGATGAALEHWG
jgi:hypothetical protein